MAKGKKRPAELPEYGTVTVSYTHLSIIVFEDTRGHVQTKCKACGRETVFNVLEMRRLRRLRLYYSSLNG